MILGPYQEKEKTKYFQLAGDIKEGIIMDLDIWQAKIELPKLKLRELVIGNQKIYDGMVKSIITSFKEATK